MIPEPSRTIPGFVAGTPLLTPEGDKPIEQLRPGVMIQVQTSDDQGDGKPHAHDDQADNELRSWEQN